MNPKAQRIAIAEARGAQWMQFESGAYWITNRRQSGDMFRAASRPASLNDVVISTSVPDYLNDLNAMHEAEKVLTESQQAGYFLELQKIIVPPYLKHFAPCITATAAQRAEAFLRAKGKWEESK